jgi:molecular chaperone DnaK
VPQIEVTFDIDANGIVNVSAKDKMTSKEQKITIQSGGGLSKSDIERMIREAEANAEKDKAKREQIEIKNQAESLIYNTEKSLKEYKDKIPADVATEIQQEIDNVKKAYGDDKVSAEELKAKLDKMQQVAMKIGEAMAKAGGSSSGSSSDSNSTGSGAGASEAKTEEAEKKP